MAARKYQMKCTNCGTLQVVPADVVNAVRADVQKRAEAERKASVQDRDAHWQKEIRRVRKEADLELKEAKLKLERVSKGVKEVHRRAEQGPTELQGEVLELDLEWELRRRFPGDAIQSTRRGVRGADVLQHVFIDGCDCGSILWEAKRAANWGSAWLGKLREDAEHAGATVRVIVSTAMPRGMESMDVIEDTWVAGPEDAVLLATALRQGMRELSQARAALEGRASLETRAYGYLVGPRFRSRIRDVAKAYGEAQDSIQKQRRAIAQQEKTLEQMVLGTVGILSDLDELGTKLPASTTRELPPG